MSKDRIRTGNLRHRLEIQQPVGQDRDAAGGKIGADRQAWSLWARVWGNVKPASGRKVWDADQVTPLRSHVVELRYRPGLKPTMRIKYGQRLLNIESIIDVEERHRDLELFCTEPM
jgi:SPP1 family predicted phage head-tail adaptor